MPSLEAILTEMVMQIIDNYTDALNELSQGIYDDLVEKLEQEIGKEIALYQAGL